ncbi:cytochrome c oxidase assembly protein COX16-domain-containing protein [Globomyces pollinis-pini]|nr:cytochrome c oxidase assembly protein COX16-domain-containing protein [Globomyces pollinis-pini]
MSKQYLQSIKKKYFRSHLSIGIPMISACLLGSFGLSYVFRARYDKEDVNHRAVEKAELLQLDANREPFDIRKAYFDMTKNKTDDYEMVRVSDRFR